ncbi:MAG: hypothetical protein F9K45_00920 [Melioribacteraceae bacterium]|nr:MAG: hypothetical protein F9K45_00920 [Melioribacteraceae bacterium]
MNIKENIKTWIPSLILFPIILWLIFNGGKFIPLLDHFNLLIHEGGHGIFKIFGDFIYTLGGTLMQIILPSLFIFYYLKNRKKTGAQISFIWLGQNFLNISIYAGDAFDRKLPLLGGNKVYHDWTHLLNQTGLILYAKETACFFFALGLISFLFCLLIPILIKDEQQINIELDLK